MLQTKEKENEEERRRTKERERERSCVKRKAEKEMLRTKEKENEEERRRTKEREPHTAHTQTHTTDLWTARDCRHNKVNTHIHIHTYTNKQTNNNKTPMPQEPANTNLRQSTLVPLWGRRDLRQEGTPSQSRDSLDSENRRTSWQQTANRKNTIDKREFTQIHTRKREERGRMREVERGGERLERFKSSREFKRVQKRLHDSTIQERERERERECVCLCRERENKRERERDIHWNER
jgi:hypothetical protein